MENSLEEIYPTDNPIDEAPPIDILPIATKPIISRVVKVSQFDAAAADSIATHLNGDHRTQKDRICG